MPLDVEGNAGGWGVQECRREAGDAAALSLRRGPLAHGSSTDICMYFSMYLCAVVICAVVISRSSVVLFTLGASAFRASAELAPVPSCAMIGSRSSASGSPRCNRLVLPLPHACLRDHMTGSRARCRPSLVHACDRLPVATGRRRLALLRCGARCACAFPRVSRHASSAAAEGACARGCARHGATRPTRWARARAAGSCSLLLPTVATDAGARRRELAAPASPHAPPTPPSSSC